MLTIKQQAYHITLDQIDEMEYFSWETIVCLVDIVCGTYQVPLTAEALDGIKSAILDDFYGEFEPRWEPLEFYQWWVNLSPEWFELTPQFKCKVFPRDFR